MMKKIVSIFTILTLFINVNAKSLIPGGESCGVKLCYNGVLVTGSYAFFDEENNRYINENQFKNGDLILSCNNKIITSIQELMDEIKVNVNNKQKIYVDVLSNNKIIKKENT